MPPRNPNGSSAALRAALTLHGDTLPRYPRTNSSRFAPGTRSARGERFLRTRNTSTLCSSVTLDFAGIRLRAQRMSPLRAFGLFRAERSDHYFMALGGDLRDVLPVLSLMYPRPLQGHFRRFSAVLTLYENLLNAFKSHGDLAIHVDLPQRCAPLSCYIATSRRGSASSPSDERFPICTHFLEARCASERKGIRVRRLGGQAIEGTPSCTSYGWESECSDGGMRACKSASAQFRNRPVLRFRYRGESAAALVARWTGTMAAW
ncbi:hypothetical protein FB451DRAFT_1175261 [Mycena latifolia]|nr:hypothetical protein FB451DRAFT_1175261 [Mycena latifolia]